MKFFALTVFMLFSIVVMSGCSSTAVVGAQLENCEVLATNQEKMDCRVRNKKALDEFDKENRRDPLSKPRVNRNI